MPIRFNPFTGQLYDDQSTGQPGSQGIDGAPGPGFTGGSYDAATGVITFTSDDGLGFSTGDVRGADGSDGSDGTNGTPGVGLQIDDQVADATARNAYSASEGSQVQQADNGHIYLYRNSAWVDLGALSGSPGLDGATGDGFTGGSYDNATGVITFTSDDGLGFSTSDVRGDPGQNGTDGADGTNGIDGTNGNDGNGFTGGSYNAATGVVTFTSDDGLGFSTGDLRGADGTDGADGADGTNGTDGADGAPGPSYDDSVNYSTFPTSSATFNWSWTTSNFWRWAPSTSDTFTINFTNLPSLYTFAVQVLELTSIPAGITWPSNISWAENTAPPLTANKKYLITFSTGGGTNPDIYGTFIEI